MKIDIQPREDHQVNIIAEVEPDRFEQSKRKAARKLSQQSKIPGFRPGKAPYDVVKRIFGEQAIAQEAVELLVDDVYPEVIKESEIKPFGPGALENVTNLDPVTFSFIVPLAPTVDLGDYRSIRVAYEPKEVTEEDVDRFIDQLRHNMGTLQPADRAAQEGDLVFLTVTGKRVNPTEGENENIVEERPIQATIHSEDQVREGEWPYPGFSRTLIGMSAGEEKDVTYTFTEETKFEALRGKEIEFHIKVQSVKSMILPDLDDSFAQTVGEFENMEALREVVRGNLEAQGRAEYDQNYLNQILEQVKGMATIKYPPQALEEEIQRTQHSLEHDLADQKMDLETYLKIMKTDRETFVEKQLKPVAQQRLERSLILEKVADEEKIQLKEEDLNQSFQETFVELQQSGNFEAMTKNMPKKQVANAVAMEAINRLMNQRIFESLKRIANDEPEATPAAAVDDTMVEAAQPEEAPQAEAEADEQEKPAE